MENSMEFALKKKKKKNKLELLYNVGIPLQGIYPLQGIIQKDTCTQPDAHCSTLDKSQDMEAT